MHMSTTSLPLERGNESHGVIVEKRTTQKGNVSFYLFVPNDQKWANTSGYYLSVSYDKLQLGLTTSISLLTHGIPRAYAAYGLLSCHILRQC